MKSSTINLLLHCLCTILNLTIILLYSYLIFIRFLILPLLLCYSALTPFLHWSWPYLILLLLCYFSALIMFFFCPYSAFTLILLCSYSPSTWFIFVKIKYDSQHVVGIMPKLHSFFSFGEKKRFFGLLVSLGLFVSLIFLCFIGLEIGKIKYGS